MKPGRLRLAGLVAILGGGFVAVVVALAAVDWRLGLFVGGVLLIVSTSPWKDLR